MSRLCQKRGKVENNGEKETKGSEGVEKGLAEVEVVDSDVASVRGLSFGPQPARITREEVRKGGPQEFQRERAEPGKPNE